jgi:membrane-associated phospholipid phosphatase
MSNQPPPSVVAPGSHHPEQRERFARLRALVYDDRLRRRLILFMCLFALMCVAALAALVRLTPVLSIDIWVSREFQERPLTRVMYIVSIFGYQPWATITAAVGVLLIGALFGVRDGLYLAAITIAQGLTNLAVKLLIGRPRPIDSLVEVVVAEHGNSFPSGHVMFYTVFFSFLAMLAWLRLPRSPIRWLVIGLMCVLVALVGPSRIVLGAHWLSDVIAAYLLGFMLLACAIEIYLTYLAPPSVLHERGFMRVYDESQNREAGVT